MNTQEAKQLGRQHHASGKQCTPHDCQEFDAVLFALVRETGNRKLYAKLRGAFNSGWQEGVYANWVAA